MSAELELEQILFFRAVAHEEVLCEKKNTKQALKRCAERAVHSTSEQAANRRRAGTDAASLLRYKQQKEALLGGALKRSLSKASQAEAYDASLP